eukprot:COSAG02_NODE_113_length_35905_cov_25.229012_14_plen_128_part_00
MSEMDKDGDGTISYTEFESWWRNNGGDLEKHRPLAFTVVLPDLNLLLVRTASTQPTSERELARQGGHVRPCPDAHTDVCCCRPDHLKCCFVCDIRCATFTQVARDAAEKQRWLLGLQAMLRKLGKGP